MPNTDRTSCLYGEDSPTTRERLAEMLLYVAAKSADDETFGAIKLNKLLYFAEFICYLQYGIPLTGAKYMRLPFGPVPKHLLPVKRDLETEGAVDELEMMYHGQLQKRIVARRPARLDLFTAEQIALVDEVIEALRSRNATSLSELSHDLSWNAAADRQEIPYQAVYIESRMPTPDDIEWAAEVVNAS